MASFNKTIITNNGRSLIAKVISGDQIKFTKMVSSSRDYTSSDLSQLTDLSNVEQTILISSIKKTSDSAVKITGIFSNKDLKTGYKFRTVGLYAIDPDLGEILYSVTTASSVDDMPANTGIGLSSLTIGLVTDVSNSNNSSLEVSDVATVSALEFNEFKDDVNSQLNDNTNNLTNHKNATVSDHDGVHGLKMERGTWTPEIKGLTTPGEVVYQYNKGSYVKIGNLVNVSASITVTSHSGMDGIAVRISGLPFQNQSESVSTAPIYRNITLLEGYTSLILKFDKTENNLTFYQCGSGKGEAFVAPSALGQNIYVTFSISYEVE